MKTLLKTPAFLLLMTILMVSALACGAPATDDKPDATGVVAPENNATESTEMPTSDSEDEIVATQTSIPEEPTIPPPPEGKVGERISIGGIAMTVLNMQSLKQIDEYTVAEEGKVYLDVEVYIENDGRSESTPYNPFYFKVKDSEGQEFTSSFSSLSPGLKSGELMLGDFTRGHVAFEVLETSTDFKLYYEPLVLFGGYKEIKVDLSQIAENPITDPEPKPRQTDNKVGDQVELAGIAVTILGVSEQTTLQGFMTPSEGYRYIDIEVIIENIGRNEDTPYNPLYFRIKDSKGFEYNTAFGSLDPSLVSGDLVKGDKVKGHVAFEVKADATGLIVYYEPMVIAGGYEVIIIGLDQ